MALDIISLAAASGSDGGLGKVGTIPISGVLYVHCPVGPTVERIDWLIDNNKAATYQLYKAERIVGSVTLTLNGLDDTDTIIINGLTFTAEDTEEDALAAERKFYTGGADDTADAVALTALINDASYGVPGVVATSAAAVITLTPIGAHVIQAVVGTATTGECAIAYSHPADLIRVGGLVSIAADTTTKEFSVEQYVDGWTPYIAISNADGAAANTVTVRACRYRYRD